MPATNFPDGVTNVFEYETLGSYVAPDPTKVTQWFDDFFAFNASNWTVTETQTGATQAAISGDNGLLALVNSAASADLNAVQFTLANFRLSTAKRAWCKFRLMLDDAVNGEFAVGLQATNATPFTIANGVVFTKLAGGTAINLNVVKASTATVAAVSTGAIANATMFDLGFAYDPATGVTAFLNGAKAATASAANLPDTVDLTVSIALRNGTAAARTLTCDYFMAAKER